VNAVGWAVLDAALARRPPAEPGTGTADGVRRARA
jgi:hypothetical protein